MNKRYILTSLLCLCTLLFSWGSASAIMIGLSTEYLTNNSDLVIAGNVEHTESYWSADGKTILTKAVVTVTELIRARQSAAYVLPASVVVEYRGGEVGDLGMRVSDEPSFSQGESVILFLKSAEPQRKISSLTGSKFTVVGRAQGKYIVSQDGIASKSGFSVAAGEEVIEDNIKVGSLIEKIRSIR
ncbi:MAG: hypothetical protein HZA17_12330 [Nitrospirae bacterium]|nr:hypothetical protein [Nitrospirota bacterium]